MTKIENKMLDFIQKHILLIFLAIVSILGCLIRAFGFGFQSGDFLSFLNPWWSKISEAGIGGLATQVGNYNIPYQIITFIMTRLPIEALAAYKLLSCFFDIVLAAASGLIVYSFSKKPTDVKFVVTYAVVFCSLTVVFNSAFWAQCDSIYVSFILLSLYCLKKEKNIPAFVFLGVAFAFKLQFIFIIPFYLIYWASTRKCSILHFLIIPAVDIIMCLPAIFLGRPFMDIFTIYAEQTDYGKLIQMNCPNIYAFMCNGSDVNNYYLFKTFSIVLVMIILGSALCLMLYKKADVESSENMLLTIAWTVFTCIMFLSSMHERYTYLLDIVLVIYAIVAMKRFWLPVACTMISLSGYCYYLFNYSAFDLKVVSVIYIAIYAFVTYCFAKDVVFADKKLIENQSAA